jgi:hypothetical protein
VLCKTDGSLALAQAEFLAQFGKVAVTACKTRGATAELGAAMQKVVAHHHVLVSAEAKKIRALNDQFVVTLQKRIKADGKTFSKMEEDYKSLSK